MSYLSQEELASFVKTSILLKTYAQAEQNRRDTQRKVAKQREEIKRLTEELRRVSELAKSRGNLILDIQRRALERQVEQG